MPARRGGAGAVGSDRRANISSAAPAAERAPARFVTTHWSLVRAAGRSSSAESRRALEALCQAYWYPIYAHVRRSGHDAATAQDLTQAFFARLLERRVLPRADRERGRFRAFLLASLRNFLRNEYDFQTARKRGGGQAVLSIDYRQAEGRYGAEPSHAETPERDFERQWALAVLEQALAALEREHRAAGKLELFEALAPCLTAGGDAPAYAEVAAALGLTEAAAKMAASRLRKQYRERIRAEIARTVADPADVDEELRSLFAALGS